MSLHAIESRVLRLEIQASRLLLRIQFLLHGLALMVLAYPLGVPVWLRLGLFAALVLSLLGLLRSETLAGSRTLLLDADGRWTRLREEGEPEPLELRDDSWVGTRMAVLRFDRERGRPLTVPLLPDSVDPDLFRRLRVRLRQQPAEEASVSSASG